MEFNAESIVALVIGVLSLIVSIIIAWRTVRVSRWSQQEANAVQAHRDYLKLAFEHPTFAFPKLMQNVDFKAETIDGSREMFDKYEWFVSYLFATIRLVLATAPKRSAWEEIAILQISYHWRYLEAFRGTRVYLKLWNKELHREIDAGIAMGKSNNL